MAEYQALINEAIAKLNIQHQAKFEEEKLSLQPLPKYQVPDYEVLTAKVSCRSTIDVRCVLYMVPARLIGQKLELHLYHDRIIGYLGTQVVVHLPRLRPTDKEKRRTRCINYRHVIEGLRRKPRAFLYCVWQQDLLPSDLWQEVWQQLKTQFDLDSAAILLVEALYIAATQDKENAVAIYLQTQLATGTLSLAQLRRQFQLLNELDVPAQQIHQHELLSYDQLLRPQTPDQPLPESQSAPQAAQTVSHADSVGTARTSSHAGRMVVCSVFCNTLKKALKRGISPTRQLRAKRQLRSNHLADSGASAD